MALPSGRKSYPGPRFAARGLAAAVGLAVASYATYVSVAWIRYGHVKRPANPEEKDSLLDRFMPDYEVVERHKMRIAAPAEITLSVACAQDLQDSAVIRGIFKARELILGSKPDDAPNMFYGSDFCSR